MKTKLSIIVPVYNVERYIKECMESLLSQTCSDFETLFVDDCSQDASVYVVEQFLIDHPNFNGRIIHHGKNGGLSAARNTGLKAATGEYILFLDSDDELSSDCIDKLTAPLNERTYDVVVGGVREQYADGTGNETEMITGPVLNPMKSYADGAWYVMAWNKLCNRKFLLDNELYFEEGLLHEDVVWSFKLASVCQSMYIENSPTYYYKIRNASIMTSMSVEKDTSIYVNAFSKIKEYIDEKGLNYNSDVYRVVEGKKSGILYSLLQVHQEEVFDKYYKLFHRIATVSPMKAYKNKTIGIGYLLRDINYCMPVAIGAFYKKMFYHIAYQLRGKKIEGAVWK